MCKRQPDTKLQELVIFEHVLEIWQEMKALQICVVLMLAVMIRIIIIIIIPPSYFVRILPTYPYFSSQDKTFSPEMKQFQIFFAS